MRKLVKAYGSQGRSVRVFVESFTDPRRQSLVRVQWREQGKRRTESLPDSAANRTKAKAYAEGVAERLTLHGPVRSSVTTLRQLGDAYLLAHPTPETWREKTRATFLARWKVIVAVLTPERRLDTITPDAVDLLRRAMREQDYAVNQVANHVQLLKSMMRFAKARRYIADNGIAEYEMRLSRDQRRLQVPEWTAAECAKILAELSPRNAQQWRPYVATVLGAVLGTRSNALLHVEWRDVDLTQRTIRWRPELDKLAKDRTQPLPRDAVRVLRIARVWRRRAAYVGPYVMPCDTAQRGKPKRSADQPYSYNALNAALKRAADRAGVRWIAYRAMHGFRRMIVNQVLATTGNLTRAGQWIGDSDVRTLARSYVRERPEELRDVAAGVALPAPEASPKSRSVVQQNSNGQPVGAGRAKRNSR